MKSERYGRGGLHFSEGLKALAYSPVFAAFSHSRRGTASLDGVF